MAMRRLSRPWTIVAVGAAALAITAAAYYSALASIASSPAALSRLHSRTLNGPRRHYRLHNPVPSAFTASSSSRSLALTTPSPTSPSLATTTPVPTATCTTSAAQGECGPFIYPQIEGTGQDPVVGNNVWNPISGWQETLYANSPADWYVTANMPAGNTGVVSYPSIGATYNNDPLSSFLEMYSSFSENMNATSGTSAWAAYDIWLNNGNNEVMIQHDFANAGPCTAAASATFGGSGGVPVQNWDLCQFGSELVWKLTGGNEQSGGVDILSMLTWLENKGYLPQDSTLGLIGYGWEICSTGGVNENFQVSSFSITTS
jgi:hypothetical protein